MSSGRVACPGCKGGLPPDCENSTEFERCPSCLTELRVFAFPALRQRSAGSYAAPAGVEGEASCFYHPLKQAVVACDSCGRFLCALCDVEVGAHHRCPACLEAGKRQGKLETVENRRTLYDGVALALAVAPLLIWPFTILTAPAALFIVIRYWRRPLSILPRTKIRYIFAALIALAQIGGWATLLYVFIAGLRTAA